MKHTLCCVIGCFFCLLSLNPVTHAQNTDNTDATVMHRFTVEAWPDYETTFSRNKSIWSPDSSLVALPFKPVEQQNTPASIIWNMYDVETGEFLFTFQHFVAWYADSTRLLIDASDYGSASVINARTRQLEFSLPLHTAEFLDEPIEDNIISLDETKTLHIHNADTGDELLTLDYVSDLPVYSPDKNYVAVTRTAPGTYERFYETGVEIYHADTLTLAHQLDNTHSIFYEIWTPRAGQPDVSIWSPDSQKIIVTDAEHIQRNPGPFHIWQPEHSLSTPFYNLTANPLWLSDSRLAIPTDFIRIQILNTATDTIEQSFIPTRRGPVTLLDWQDPYLIFRSGDIRRTGFYIGIYDTANDELIYHNYIDFFQHWLEEDTLVIIESVDGLKRINLSDGRIQQSYEFELNSSAWPTVSPNRQWAAAGLRQSTSDSLFPVQLYRLNPPELVARLERHTQETNNNIAWSPNNQLFISSDSSTYIIWQLIDNAGS